MMKLSLKATCFGAVILAAAAVPLAATFTTTSFAQAQSLAASAAVPEATIRALQVALNKQGIAVKTDGILNEETRTAIRQYQTQHHLPVTGEPDNATLAKLGVATQGAAPEGQSAQGQTATTGTSPQMMGPQMMQRGMMSGGMMNCPMMQGQAQSGAMQGQMQRGQMPSGQMQNAQMMQGMMQMMQGMMLMMQAQMQPAQPPAAQ